VRLVKPEDAQLALGSKTMALRIASTGVGLAWQA
jgi:hypothetical protein